MVTFGGKGFQTELLSRDACHTRFAVFFPFPCCCVCSLKLIKSILASNKTLVLEHPDWAISTLLLVAIEPQSGKMIFKIWSVLSVFS